MFRREVHSPEFTALCRRASRRARVVDILGAAFVAFVTTFALGVAALGAVL
jgi:hypothetical protein